ncbi:MAG: hypothetical protein NT062_13480 [Proteobacteria bacterium]|nr:hypothetical protein [Pseudomonadota bacterium]
MSATPLALASLLTAGCWGAPVDQSPVCATYVHCIDALDRTANQTTNLDRYVDGGACWGNPELARGCTTSCRRTLERLRTREPTLPLECAP